MTILQIHDNNATMRVHSLPKVTVKSLSKNSEKMMHLLKVFVTELNGEATNSWKV